jgi:hypothetical protein
VEPEGSKGRAELYRFGKKTIHKLSDVAELEIDHRFLILSYTTSLINPGQ